VRKLILLLLLASLLFAAWQHRDRLIAATEQRALPALNKLAKEVSPQSEAPLAHGKTALRKCLRGTEVIFTDAACPAGFKGQAVVADRVTVVPAADIPPPATSQSSSATALHQALELDKNAQLGEKIIERAVAGGAK
jgi:hypothetical protein